MTDAPWIQVEARLPAEGRRVEILILANCSDINLAKRLGDGWWVERKYGGPYLMGNPAAPALWRQTTSNKAF